MGTVLLLLRRKAERGVHREIHASQRRIRRDQKYCRRLVDERAAGNRCVDQGKVRDPSGFRPRQTGRPRYVLLPVAEHTRDCLAADGHAQNTWTRCEHRGRDAGHEGVVDDRGGETQVGLSSVASMRER